MKVEWFCHMEQIHQIHNRDKKIKVEATVVHRPIKRRRKQKATYIANIEILKAVPWQQNLHFIRQRLPSFIFHQVREFTQ